jgi:hypothetical protein
MKAMYCRFDRRRRADENGLPHRACRFRRSSGRVRPSPPASPPLARPRSGRTPPAGDHFLAQGGASSAMRLNFSLAAPEAAERGLEILGELLREEKAACAERPLNQLR